MTKAALDDAAHDAAHDVCNVDPRATWTAPTCEVLSTYDAEASGAVGTDYYGQS
jgi:hypothetical protein